MKPLAIMFPGLLEKDPQTLEGMLTKAMSTTEVTKHLVKLGEKADFTFMKKSTRLIPKDKVGKHCRCSEVNPSAKGLILPGFSKYRITRQVSR